MNRVVGTNHPHPTSWQFLFLALAILWCTGEAEATVGAKLVAGGNHTCELSPAGQVRCWGSNREGQLGTGNNLDAALPRALLGIPPMSALSAGRTHTCAISAASGGTVLCWGGNDAGQLGNGTNANSNKPQNVVTAPGVLLTGATAVAAGDYHTCAVKSDGSVVCWGENIAGQLGTGNTDYSNFPQVVMQAPGIPLASATSVTAGGGHSCALKSDGQVMCWGWNTYGQAGIGSNTSTILHATTVSTLAGVTSVAAGYFHTCALTSALKAYCWGVNSSGQGGTGVENDSNILPTAVDSLNDFTQITVGSGHTCALSSLGQVYCWGGNHYGEIGIGSSKAGFSIIKPTLVPGLAGVETIAAGGDHSCAVQANGAKYCWGNNQNGQLGIGIATGRDQHLPHVLPGVGGQVALTAGGDHTCTISSFFGAIACTGDNRYGQLGLGDQVPRKSLTGLPGSIGSTMIDAGNFHTCAVKQDTSVWCWGENAAGQLGTNNFLDSYVPVKVVGENGPFTGVSKVAVGSAHTCALKTDQTLWCWGRNEYGQLGLGFTFGQENTPQLVQGVSGVVSIAAGSFYTCALTSDGTVRCWGENGDGQLGTGVYDVDLNAPPVEPIAGLTGVSAIAAGFRHTCALSSGRVYCWGRNDKGQLGTGDDNYTNAPVPVAGGLVDVSAVDAGHLHTCAVRTNGVLACWGFNDVGQLGSETSSIVQETPQMVPNLGTVSAVATGGDHTCALLQNGTVACMGSAHFGQLGNGEFGHNALPLLTAGLFFDGFE